MRADRTILTTATLGVALLLAACGSPGSSGTEASGTDEAASTGGQVCEAVAGDTLVVLTDDQGLQNAENVVPVVNAEVAAAHPEVLEVLDAVSATLDTAALIELNKQVDIERRTSPEVAAEYLAAAGLDTVEQVGDGTALTVGAPNFSEGATLANLYADALSAAGFEATAETIGNRETYLPVLEQGDLAVVPEYLSSLTEFLNKSINGADVGPVASADVDTTVTALTDLAAQSGLVAGTPSAAQDQNAFAVTEAFADEYQVASVSDLAAACGGGVTLGGPPECPERDFCQLGLEDVYGLNITEFTSLDAGGPLTKSALQQGAIAVGLVFSSDAALAG